MFNPNDSLRTHHTLTLPDEIGEYVLLCGDPQRVETIAKKLDDAKFINKNREITTYTGKLEGKEVSVVSTGIGCPSASIVIEELIKCGAKTLIRIGSCGRVCEKSYAENLDAFIATSAIRNEGTTPLYIPIEYPAVADIDVTNALVKSAKKIGINTLEGIVLTKDNYYIQYDADQLPFGEEFNKKWDVWCKSNVIAVEMEASALFIISSIKNCRSGVILNRKDMDKTIDVAIEAMRTLIKNDK